MEAIIESIINLFKLPLFALFKFLIILPLNFIPSPVWEVHGVQGTSTENRPDLRAVKKKVKGDRKLKLGCALIAYQRGVIVRAHLRTDGTKRVWGVFQENFDSIVDKWTF